MEVTKIDALVGKIAAHVAATEDTLTFTLEDGSHFQFWHDQDCCESVSIESITGELDDLIGSPILIAEEVISTENPDGFQREWQESFTWTFYKFATIKGYVDVRWYGESNGYYSESVSYGYSV